MKNKAGSAQVKSHGIFKKKADTSQTRRTVRNTNPISRVFQTESHIHARAGFSGSKPARQESSAGIEKPSALTRSRGSMVREVAGSGWSACGGRGRTVNTDPLVRARTAAPGVIRVNHELGHMEELRWPWGAGTTGVQQSKCWSKKEVGQTGLLEGSWFCYRLELPRQGGEELESGTKTFHVSLAAAALR